MAQSEEERREARRIAKANQRRRDRWIKTVRRALGDDWALAEKLLREDPDMADVMLAELAALPAKERGHESARYPVAGNRKAGINQHGERYDASDVWEMLDHKPGKPGFHETDLDYERTWFAEQDLNPAVRLRPDEWSEHEQDWNN